MSLFVVSRRKIVYQHNTLGASQVIYVPGTDQVQVLKDATNTAAAARPAAKAQGRQGPQLYRSIKGQRTVYGALPLELRERRENMKVWLAEDLVSQDVEAFFYILSAQVVIHGVRERTDEGKLAWRTAQLAFPDKKDDLKSLETALADYMFANQDQKICVAVANDIKIFRAVQAIATPLGLTPVPISTLKPMSGLAPLYSHLNFTWLYLLIMALGGVGVAMLISLYVLKQAKMSQIEQEISQIEQHIQSVQINPRIGHIRQAAAVLAELVPSFSISPTSLIAAAGEPLVPFGQIQEIKLGTVTPERVQELGSSMEENEVAIEVNLTNSVDLLLSDQETRAANMLAAYPWVRKVIRSGAIGAESGLIMILKPMRGQEVPQ